MINRAVTPGKPKAQQQLNGHWVLLQVGQDSIEHHDHDGGKYQKDFAGGSDWGPLASAIDVQSDG